MKDGKKMRKGINIENRHRMGKDWWKRNVEREIDSNEAWKDTKKERKEERRDGNTEKIDEGWKSTESKKRIHVEEDKKDGKETLTGRKQDKMEKAQRKKNIRNATRMVIRRKEKGERCKE